MRLPAQRFSRPPPDFITPLAVETNDRDAESLVSCLVFLAQIDIDLAVIVEAWPTLPEPIRAGIVAMVRASNSESD